jgi:hypothetical protein
VNQFGGIALAKRYGRLPTYLPSSDIGAVHLGMEMLITDTETLDSLYEKGIRFEYFNKKILSYLLNP